MTDIPIIVEYNPNADTRTAKGRPSYAQVTSASTNHIVDVQNAMNFLLEIMSDASENHDYDKIDDSEGFYRDFINSLTTGVSFTDGTWYQRHKNERHHSIETLEDVNLLDILEYTCDCVCATLARTGQKKPIGSPSPETLMKAWENTVKLLYDNMELLNG